MFGQIPDFSNSFEFLRKLWATGSGMPSGLMPGLGAMTPPMDLDEVDKRIHDLKAVESWLQLNTNLLRTTIQGLEVQRATLVALQTFGNALSPEAMQNAMENVARAANAPSAHPPQHHQPFGASQTVSEAQADAENDEPDDDDAPPDGTEAAAQADGGADAAAAQPGAAPLPPNASLWWNLLQQQFSQIASSAAAASAAAAGASPFGGMAGFGPAAAPGAEGVEPGVKGDPPAQRKPAPNGNARPAARKAAAKKPAAKKPATKATAKKTAATGTAKGAAGKSPAKAAARPEPGRPPAPGTAEDSFE
ncbi:PhaM family polyhydroxyalkanoate granule multifunctional regulatory protein [Cupriavidus sp. D384]|uniref:PhaM family polyhydroxyalkanoate granule multifunctional regulatory protein n=1 Tax=Cupriavidus sp. D384 TaxID=1538095 RepID=UPI00082A8A89|nr:PhaM family polyhydroxyalkanoate granule multifunctional regulatory protein [Cupriavidus sp. D384]